tara:strand:- start:5549 stop:5755 length:207 start_codon:yes stop_codon:yes gene_type:complete
MKWNRIEQKLPSRSGLYLTFDDYGTWNLYWFNSYSSGNGGEFDIKYDNYHGQYIPVKYWTMLPDPPIK